MRVMKSLSLTKLLFYLSLSFERIAQLDEQGDRHTARERLRIMESILTRALQSVRKMQSALEEPPIEEVDPLTVFRAQLAAMPETAERD